MSFGLTKPSGYAFGEILPSADVEDIDAKTAASIDGVGGGTYAPSVAITIGGAGLAVTGPLSISGLLSITGNSVFGNADTDTVTFVATPTFQAEATFEAVATFEDGLVVSASGIEIHGSSSFGSNVTIAGDLEIAQTLDVTGSVTLHDDLIIATGGNFNCNATASFDAAVTVNADSDFWALAVFHAGATIPSGDTLSINGTLSLKSVLSTSGSGRVPFRFYGSLGNANADVDVTQGNFFQLPDSNSATRTYTIVNTGAQAGDFMFFYQDDGSELPFGIQVFANGVLSALFSAGAETAFALYLYDGSSWHKVFTDDASDAQN